MPPPLLLTSNEPFLSLVERGGRATAIALDCEFHSEKRYRPTLYLTQIGFAEDFAAVDPARVDLRPLRAVLENPGITKLFHAGREDIRLLTRATGAKGIENVFDTQIAAAFLGHGPSIGYARLVKDLLGVELDKSNQFTDWSRELTDAQVDYALNDVRYLLRIAVLLRTELERRGRLEWALEASRAMSTTALAEPDPRRLYRKISGVSGLGPVELGVLRELAIWRDAIASSENCRPESVASDPGLKQVALRPPAKHGQLRGMRGLGIGGSDKWWPSLRDAVARGTAEPEPPPPAFDVDPRVESIALLLGALRRAIAVEHDLAPELIASTAELRTLAEWHVGGRTSPVPEIDALGGWRRELIGTPLLEVLAGTTTVKVAAGTRSGLELTRTES